LSIVSDAAILVFAKAPLPGRAKTRLIPKLGAAGAARLQARLVALTLRTAHAARFSAVELHATPSRTHGLFAFYAKKFQPMEIKRQRGRDLGERMHNALARALRRHRPVILIGTDCPALTAADLRRAARLLCGGCDAVLAPAEDGGYALIGVRKFSAALFSALFSGIEWGGPFVYAETVRKLDRAGYRWRALRTVWDLDRPADLERFASLRLRLASARLRLGPPRLRSRRSS
jgi:rSAM/selenodomain-associated transferase 1